MAVSRRKCKGCGKFSKTYITINLSAFCDYDCAIAYSRTPKAKSKAYDSRTRELKAEFEDRDIKTWRRRAKDACHYYIRLRDQDLGCISCGTMTADEYHAGHFIPSGRNSKLRYHPWNINRQCAQCNYFEGGNDRLYEESLRKKIGDESVDWIKAQGNKKRWTVDELKLVTEFYKIKTRELKGEYQ